MHRDGEDEDNIEYDIEKKIVEFIREKRPTFHNYNYWAKIDDVHHVKAKFHDKENLWFELGVLFYDGQHEVLGGVWYPRKDCDYWDSRWRDDDGCFNNGY